MSLTREEKLRKLDLIAEKKRRILEKKPTYRPNEGQLAVHMDPKPIRIVAAANGGGKTTLGVQEVLWAAAGYNPLTKAFTKVPCRIVVLLDNPMKVAEVWLEEMKKWTTIEEKQLHKHGKPYVNEITFKNGSSIMFMFHQQEDLVFEGIQLDFLVPDEPPPRRIWIALTRGMRRKGSMPKALIIGTPISAAWLYNDLWKKAVSGERDDIGIHRFGIEVNRSNLAEGYIEQFSKNLTEAEKKVRLQGHFSHLEGLALAHMFDRQTHIVKQFPWPKGKPAVLVIDPHFSKPHVACLVGATGDGRIYYIKEMETKSPPERFAAELRDFLRGDWRVIDYVIDSLGETPGTGGKGNLSFADVLRQRGIPVRATDFEDKNDEDFIQRIQQVLEVPEDPDNFGRRRPKLAIVEGNDGIIDDIETCQWQKYRQHELFKPKLDISSKDRLACLKYALATSIAFVSEVGKMPKMKRSRPSPWGGRRE